MTTEERKAKFNATVEELDQLASRVGKLADQVELTGTAPQFDTIAKKIDEARRILRDAHNSLISLRPT